MMFRCSRKAMGHGGSWTMGCQKGRPSLLPCKTFEDLWSTSWILMVPPLGTKAMQMPRDALLQPMAGVWDGSLISCAPPSRRQRRREVMVCKCLQVKETKMTKITVVVSFHMLSHALRFFSFSIDLSCKRIGVAWLRFRFICRRSASPADSCTGHHLRPCNLGCMKLMKSTTILYALSQQACFETFWNVFKNVQWSLQLQKAYASILRQLFPPHRPAERRGRGWWRDVNLISWICFVIFFTVLSCVAHVLWTLSLWTHSDHSAECRSN